jgi:hypothetical protein
MRTFLRGSGFLTITTLVLLLLSGCVLTVPIKDPVPSAASYTKPPDVAPATLVFTDARTPENKAQPAFGRLKVELTAPDKKPFDPVPWLAANTMKELGARGVPAQLGTDAAGATIVTIRLLQIENRRVSGYSPFETFTSLKADVATGKGTHRIAAFIMRGKMPIWSGDEVIDPTFNDPLDLVAKELAAKLNQILFGARLSDAQVDDLVTRTSGKDANFRDVYELGFGNNPRAIPHLVKLSSSKDGYVMRAAMSSLGVLRADQHFDLLVKEAENTKDDFEDRATALKGIGDLGTPRSRAYLEKERARLETLTDAEAVRAKGLIGLYLD